MKYYKNCTWLFMSFNLIFFSLSIIVHSQGLKEQIKSKPVLCGQFSNSNVETLPGFCIGIVLNKSDTDISGEYNMLNPREIIQLPNNDDFMVTDLGQWTKEVGRIWRLQKQSDGQYKLVLLFKDLPFPHGIALGPNNFIYVGLSNKIVRFNPDDPINLETVITFPKTPEEQLHPLKDIIFNERGDIIIGQGSLSDHCENEIQKKHCIERENYGNILLYNRQGPESWSKTPRYLAKGLRNSAALTIGPKGHILQVESSTDFTDDYFIPYDELNLIIEDKDYGWPYMVGNIIHQEWNKTAINDELFVGPYSLLPPHSTPLGLTYVNSSSIFNKPGILISLHGYRNTGSRILFVPLNEQGLPSRTILDKTYPIYENDTVIEQPFPDNISDNPVIDFIVITTKWNKQKPMRSHGSPVGMTQARDGSIWIVDDKNASVLQLNTN